MKRLGLHSAIWATASTHFVVDAYGNMYAPLLPLLIPQLGLSLETVGKLAMCYQLASSVSQLGFGTLADRWRPRVLLMGGPILSVLVLSLIGASTSVPMLAAILLIGGLGGAAFHPPAAALVHAVSGDRKGFAMSTHISGGSLGFALAPLVFAPAVVVLGPSWSWFVALPGLVALGYTLQLMRRVEIPKKQGARQLGGSAAVRQAARPALHHRRAADADGEQPFGVPARVVDATGPRRERGERGGIALSLRQHRRRLPRRAVVRSLWRAPGDHVVACPFRAVPARRSADHGLDADAARLGRWIPAAVHASGKRHLRSATRAGECGDGLLAHDGLRVGCGLVPGAGGRDARGSAGAWTWRCPSPPSSPSWRHSSPCRCPGTPQPAAPPSWRR